MGFAQGEYNNWCFGEGILLNFNSGNPVVQSCSVNTNNGGNLLGTTSISDKNGNLLFYVNSDTIWSANHSAMTNGTLNRSSGALQSVNILPFPCNDSLYYVFAFFVPNIPGTTSINLEYSVVNMNKNNGLGEVVQKQIPIDTNVLTAMGMTRHANNRDYWITYQKKDTNIYYSRLISSMGIGSKIFSQVGSNKYWSLGTLKFSGNSDYLTNCIKISGIIECYQFDNSTGILSNSINLLYPASVTHQYPISSQFSKDQSKLYITGPRALIQFDFSSGNPTTISNSAQIISWDSNYTFASGYTDISLAPDNKIYISQTGNFLSIINNPNSNGVNCGFANSSLNCFASTVSGFPTILPNLFVHREVLTDSLFCQYDTVNLYLSDTNFIDSVAWNFGDTASGALNTSKDVVPLHVFNEYGLYPIEVIIYSGCSTDTINDTIRINPTPIANLGNDTILCEGDSMQLQFNDTSFNYLWSTGDSTMQIQILQSDTFSIAISSICGTDYDTIVIDSLIPALVHLPPDTLMCDNDSLFLDATIQSGTYTWSNGVTDSNQWVSVADTFWVTATNFCGTSSDTVVTTYTHTPNFDLGADTALCAGDTLVLNAHDTLSDYLWSTGDTFALDTITTNGIYSVTTTNVCGAFSDTLQAWFLTAPVVNLGNDTVICLGDSIALNDTSLFASYAWNTALVADTLWVTSAGTYQLTVTNKCGATADTILVETDTIPLVDLGNDTLICQGASVALSAEFSRSSYLWSTGSTDSAIIASVEDIYWATATNLCGSDTDSVYIDVDSVLVVDLGPDTILCTGEQTTLFSNEIGDSYLWNTGTTLDSLVVIHQDTYSLDVTNICGTFSDTIAVYYDNSPITNLGPDSTYCLNSLVDLNAYWSRASYLWNTSETTPDITANFSGNYSVQVTNLCGYDGDTVNIQYDVPINFNLGVDTLLCEGDSFLLSAPAHNATWVWHTTATDSTLMVNQAGTYSVTATNVCGDFSDAISIRLETVPVLTNNVTDTAFCEGNTYTVNVIQNNATSLLWLDGTSDYLQEFDSAGVYSYALINVCGATSDTFELEIQYPADADLGNDTIICFGEQITKAFNYPNHTYEWHNGLTDSVRYITEPGLYGVTIFSPVGCESYDDLEVASCEAQLFIPNAFTPQSGDDLNNTFVIKGEGIRKFRIVIYDRWGSEVFQSDDLSYSWDGNINNQHAAPGIYSYKIWYNTGHSSESVSKVGVVNLLR